MDKQEILKKVKFETDKGEKGALVPKIVYGTDKLGNYFIYFKIKDFKIRQYLPDSFVILYQNPKGNEEAVKKRVEDIIKFFHSEYECGDGREFGDNGVKKGHFFIKKKLFRIARKVDKFYLNTMKKMIEYLKDNLMEGISEFADDRFLKEPGLFNWIKKDKGESKN